MNLSLTEVTPASAPGRGRPGTLPDQLPAALATFVPITLAEAAGAALMDRSECKYVLPQAILVPVLAELCDDYRVLTIAGRRISRYRSLYFDTPDLALYQRHQAGAADRYKIRSREYVDSHTAFFEIKHRMPNQRTHKSRIATPGLLASPGSGAGDFVAAASPYSATDLRPSLWNCYLRITLVSKGRAERVTLDLDTGFSWQGQGLALPGIVIAEVKFEGAIHGSPFAAVMRRRGIRTTSFSKYCVGLSLLCPTVKYNRFKQEHLLIERLMRGDQNGRH